MNMIRILLKRSIKIAPRFAQRPEYSRRALTSIRFVNNSATTTSEKQEGSRGIPIETRPSYYSNKCDKPLLEKTIGQLLDEAVDKHSTRTCIVSCHENTRLTFAEVRSKADKLAAGLKKLGLQKGDRIGIWGPNTIDWYITFFALARAGYRLVALNPAEQSAEIEYCLGKFGVRAVVAPESFKSQQYVKMLQEATSKCPSLEHIIVSTAANVPHTRISDLETLASAAEVEAIAAQQNEISPLDPFAIQLTSGTTGRPKAAVLSHRSIVNGTNEITIRAGLDAKHNTVCLHLPFFHIFGLMVITTSTLTAGATIALPSPSFNPEASLDTIVKENCTAVYGTPTMWIDLISAQRKIRAPIKKIRIGLMGGAPAPPELYQKIKSDLGVKNIWAVYGLTESVGICFQSLQGDDDYTIMTGVGYLGNQLEAKVVDDNGNPVPFGTPGELLVRGYNTMMGYWEDEENTAKTLTKDGWLKTGDQFILESSGYGTVVGRRNDMINRGGENIYPREIEDLLQKHPAVIEAHVIGVKDYRLGEEVCACIRLQEGSSVTADTIRQFCKDKIAHYKIPKYVHFVDNFPRTTSGKVRKDVLRRSLEDRGSL